MQHRVESASTRPETPQLTPEENEIYMEVFEVRVENGATPEEADRFAMEAVERFREEQRRGDRDAERERERSMEDQLEREFQKSITETGEQVVRLAASSRFDPQPGQAAHRVRSEL
mgnify:CR=1 FL=1